MANGLETKSAEALKLIFAQVLKQTATLLSTVLRVKTQISLQEIATLSVEELAGRYPSAQLISRFAIANDVQGEGILAIDENFARILCDISTGGSGKNPPEQIGQNELGVLTQLVNQMLAAFSAALSQTLSKKVNLSNPDLKLSTLEADGASVISQASSSGTLISAQVSLEGIADGSLLLGLGQDVAGELAQALPAKLQKAGQNIEPLNLFPLEKSGASPSGDLGSLLVDIPLQLSVELGRTRMPLKDVLELGVGSIIELERLSGEPVDIMLNNKPLAKGEVVIIDENIGVRLTHIINPNERV